MNTAFPQAIVQTCIIHLIRNTFRYASRKYWDKISVDLRPIYTADTPTEARRRYEEFAEKWGRAHPAIKRLWDNAWEEFIPFLDYCQADAAAADPGPRKEHPSCLAPPQPCSSGSSWV